MFLYSCASFYLQFDEIYGKGAFNELTKSRDFVQLRQLGQSFPGLVKGEDEEKAEIEKAAAAAAAEESARDSQEFNRSYIFLRIDFNENSLSNFTARWLQPSDRKISIYVNAFLNFIENIDHFFKPDIEMLKALDEKNLIPMTYKNIQKFLFSCTQFFQRNTHTLKIFHQVTQKHLACAKKQRKPFLK